MGWRPSEVLSSSDVEHGKVLGIEAAIVGSQPRSQSPLEDEVVILFDQLRDKLLRYLSSSLGVSTPDGEELIQEVFLALFRHLQAGKPKHNLRAWVFQVAHNIALKHQESVRRNRETLQECDEAITENLFVDPEPDPEARLAQRQRQRRLLGVWRALPEQERRCLALRAEGLTYREIAHVLEISLGAVSLSLGRSLARFARAAER